MRHIPGMCLAREMIPPGTQYDLRYVYCNAIYFDREHGHENDVFMP